jgi:pyrimidine deaminase RibD-like protein
MTELQKHKDMLRKAIEISRKAYREYRFKVGAIIADDKGNIIETGYTGEISPDFHAEEAALHKARQNAHQPNLEDFIIYSSMEPCSKRASRPKSCCEHIIEAGIKTVVYAYREPPVFVACDGHNMLVAAQIEVIEVQDLADEVAALNAHLLT